MRHGIIRSSQLGDNWSAEHHLTSLEGHTVRNTYRLSDPACAEDLVIRLPVDEDTLEPWVGGRQIDEFCNWWTDPKGRGYLALEDGYGIILVDASSGEPTIETWSDIDDERWELERFPFSTLTYSLEGTQ